MKKLYNFSDYDLILDNRENKYLYKIILALVLIGIIFILCKFKLYIYENGVLIKDNSMYQLVINIDKLNEISTTRKIIINKKLYHYKIVKVADDYTNINGTIFQSIYLDIDYPKSDKVVNCLFLKKKSTIVDILKEFIRGG